MAKHPKPQPKSKEKAHAVVHKLHRAKPHLDYIAALLTIPVLITAIIINFNNLHPFSKATPTPTSAPSKIIYDTAVQTVKTTPNLQPTSSPNCIPGIGQVSIDSPQEGQTVNSNPVCVSITYQSQNHCGVVWAYRINNGSWSDYSNNSVCLYNMPTGKISYDLQVKSLVNTDNEILHRTFQYVSQVTPTTGLSPTSAPTPGS